MSEIKVEYVTARGSMSKAYVAEEPDQFQRHIGVDKHSDHEIYVFWNRDRWEELLPAPPMTQGHAAWCRSELVGYVKDTTCNCGYAERKPYRTE